MTQDERALDALMRVVGGKIEDADDALAFQSEAFLTWLAEDLRAGLSTAERERDEREATAFAERTVARRASAQVEQRMPRRALRYREAAWVTTVSQAVGFAKAAGCAPLLGLCAAAGSGRDLWDEPSETWVELPADLPSAAYLAMGVSGDSMLPVLTPRDVILVKLGASPVVNDLVVARVPDAGFVVKRIASLTPRHLELASFNDAYPPVTIERLPAAVLGTVVARFSRTP
jgi:SOS-response transcriptional repressor LexA